MVRTLACHARGRGFKSHLGRHPADNIRGALYAVIAQSVERILGKDEVPSSNLGNSSNTAASNACGGFFIAAGDKSKQAEQCADHCSACPVLGEWRNEEMKKLSC